MLSSCQSNTALNIFLTDINKIRLAFQQDNEKAHSNFFPSTFQQSYSEDTHNSTTKKVPVTSRAFENQATFAQ